MGHVWNLILNRFLTGRQNSTLICPTLFFSGDTLHFVQHRELTGKEGGMMMCLGEQLNVPTAIRAFTGMVNI